MGVGLFVLLHMDAAAGAAGLIALLPGGRLVYPRGYVNAGAAQWLMAAWPALLLARERRLPWWLRGALAGGAVLLAEVALLSQSRGSVYAEPVMLVLVFALLPGRVRTFALLVAVAAGIAAAAPAVLRVGERVGALEGANGGVAPHSSAVLHGATAAVHGAVVATLLSALAIGVVVAVGAALERRRTLSPAAGARVHRGVTAVAVALLVALLAGGWAAAGNPVTRTRHAWDTFKSPKGYGANSNTGSRLTSGLGSSRYDFYRVALDEFAAHPLLGIGADNFAEPYLAHGRSTETPRYPHSVELRTLAQTGLVGALLALVGLGAALLAAWRALARHPDPLTRAVAAAAVAGFAYWVVHGSFDWLWEFAGLGAPAFALLGLACALAPRTFTAKGAVPVAGVGPLSSFSGPNQSEFRCRRAPSALSFFSGSNQSIPPRGSRLRAAPRKPPPATGGGAGRSQSPWALWHSRRSLTAPWLSSLELESAAHVWVRSPAQAYARLDHAAQLNPLSDEPYVVAGSIALRLGEYAHADREFALALERTPGDAYATLERGAIASASGDRREALVLLERAVRLAPRDPIARAALATVRGGHRVDIGELTLSILRNAQQFS